MKRFKRFKGLLLLMAMIVLALNLFSAQVAADTTDVDTHFSVGVTESADSKSGSEKVEVIVKNITNQLANNVSIDVELPQKFAEKLGRKSVIEKIDTLKAGESKVFAIALTNNAAAKNKTENLPLTGDRISTMKLVVGLAILGGTCLLLIKRKRLSLLIVLVFLGTPLVVNASDSYTHLANHKHQVQVAGESLAFRTVTRGDFAVDTGKTQPSDKADDPDNQTKPKEEPIELPRTPTHLVSFNLNGGLGDSALQEVELDKYAVEPAAPPTRSGFSFEGWSQTKDEVDFWDFSVDTVTYDVTLYAKWVENYADKSYWANISYDANGASEGEVPLGGDFVKGLDVEILGNTGDLGKLNGSFIGWNTKADGTGTSYNAGDVLPAIDQDYVLYAQWYLEYKVYFRTFDGVSLVRPAQRATKANNFTIDIPDMPEDSKYQFLGWSETPYAAKTTSLYVPENFDDVRERLNAADRAYLGYPTHSSHQLSNINSDVTLYAVYYNKLKGTTEVGDEFIWADAIWRVLTVDGNQRMVIKFNALTQSEVGLAGEEAAKVNFRVDRTTYFDITGKNGYEGSELEAIIDDYYTQYISTKGDSQNVLDVNLNNPRYIDFVKDGFSGYLEDSPYTFYWGSWYEDTRFATTIGGDKQAFALSLGDINQLDEIYGLLRFSYSNEDYCWLRSVGNQNYYASRLVSGTLNDYGGTIGDNSYNSNVPEVVPVRPALYLSFQGN
ncbi:MAG: InlB B-repeat-containing protein [Streptococcaceae bacterium]|jgi:uncharacterized repeat protein (TIGR02543 family)/LPXTG-motif cell wall-anchored protein|nr:InlB B-repeat-containing protein [Streptococcaceae bacterium]